MQTRIINFTKLLNPNKINEKQQIIDQYMAINILQNNINKPIQSKQWFTDANSSNGRVSIATKRKYNQ